MRGAVGGWRPPRAGVIRRDDNPERAGVDAAAGGGRDHDRVLPAAGPRRGARDRPRQPELEAPPGLSGADRAAAGGGDHLLRLSRRLDRPSWRWRGAYADPAYHR